jgi:hypothetical protein
MSKQDKHTSFHIEDPIPEPVVFVPEGSDLNWDCQPMVPPQPCYTSRDEEEIIMIIDFQLPSKQKESESQTQN